VFEIGAMDALDILSETYGSIVDEGVWKAQASKATPPPPGAGPWAFVATFRGRPFQILAEEPDLVFLFEGPEPADEAAFFDLVKAQLALVQSIEKSERDYCIVRGRPPGAVHIFASGVLSHLAACELVTGAERLLKRAA
jgi:hypothetical protein